MRKLGISLMAASFAWLGAPALSQADQVILDDLIVDGSACIGFDCVNGESFGFDTIRIKENNLRIRAVDTSSTASFASNDWQITFNDSANGGANKFSIDDIDGGRTPFTIEAGAPSHSLYVDDGGRLGLGTSTPVVDVHVKSGNTPTLRLEQDGSSGFTPQTFDIAANEANFFVRDATNGSTLPFRIIPGADTNALVIAANNDVGMGTLSPSADLHISDASDTNVTMRYTADSSRDWITGLSNALDQFSINALTNAGNEFVLDNTGALTITGAITTGGGTCGGGCDKVFQPDYELESIDEHAELMWKNGHLPAVGPTIENGVWNISDKTGRMLNELEKAHIYIEQLNTNLNDKAAQLSELQQQNAALATRLAALEAAVTR